MEGEKAGDSKRFWEGAPEIPGGLGRGRYVSVSARIGNDVAGYVCDRDDTGLLIEVHDPSGDRVGYEYLPWTSIERVGLGE